MLEDCRFGVRDRGAGNGILGLFNEGERGWDSCSASRGGILSRMLLDLNGVSNDLACPAPLSTSDVGAASIKRDIRFLLSFPGDGG